MISTALLASTLTLSSFFNSMDFEGFDKLKEMQIAKSASQIEISQNSDFSTQTTSFNAGQTIYVRITSDVSGSTKKELNLRDNSYNLITSYSLSQITSSPPKFAANFPAPNAQGNYSLEANLETNGSVVNLVRTITVNGNGLSQSSDSQVSVKVKNEANTSNSQVNGESTQESPPSSPTDATGEAISSLQSEQKSGIAQLMWKIMKSVFSALF